jgi:hypothetical protein
MSDFHEKVPFSKIICTVMVQKYQKPTGETVRLSQQALIDCSWGFGNNGCDGGEDFRVYQAGY